MSTVKISELPAIVHLNANTGNTMFMGVDIPTGITGKMSASVLAHGLYSNTSLNVGNNDITFPGVVGQFASNNENYLQVNLQNLTGNGTGDFVVTADTGTDSLNYIDLGIAGSTYNNASPNNSLGTALNILDGYLYVQGNTGHVGGNLVIGTTVTGTKINFIAGGINQQNIVAYIDSSGIHSQTITSPTTYANGAFVEANAAFLKANSAYGSQNTTGTYANSAYNQANTATNNAAGASLYANASFTQSNAAFVVANNALANTSGTFAGNLIVTGNLTSKYALTVNNTSMPGNTQYVVVTGTSTGAIGVPSNPGYTFHSAVDGGNRVVAETYSNTATEYASFIGRRGRGTAANPLSIQNGDIIVRFGGNAYGTTKFSQFSDARIEFVATETHTDTAKGTKIRFLNTENGTNTPTEIATFNANTVTFTGTVSPTKGFLFTPNVLNTITTFGLDFNRDSLVKFNVNDNATITLSNYVYGKMVEVWITNSAAQNKTVTHGCLANNSTVKATSFTITAGACAYLRYFSIDGDQANTYVSIVA